MDSQARTRIEAYITIGFTPPDKLHSSKAARIWIFAGGWAAFSANRVPNRGFHLTAAPVALWVAGGSLTQPQVNPRSLGAQMDYTREGLDHP